jgi:DNA-directed RNA polymerase specialized sigma24 family protein
MAVGKLAPVLLYLRKVSGGETEPDDGWLLDRFVCDQDAEAFAALVRRHGPMVLGVCRRMLGCSDDADDAFQAVFLLLVRKARVIRKCESIGPWMHKVARRTALKIKSRIVRERARLRPLDDAAAPVNDDFIWRELRPVLDDAIGSTAAAGNDFDGQVCQPLRWAAEHV